MKIPAFFGFVLPLIILGSVLAEPSGIAPRTISIDQLGAEAQKQHPGETPSIFPTASGARLEAVMQDLAGEATPEGLWLSSTAEEDAGKPNRFRVRAMEVGRDSPLTSSSISHPLPPTGTVFIEPGTARFARSGLVEEYTVSTDGVRQDFVIPQRPQGSSGALSVMLEVTGASSQAAPYGAKITVAATGRELAYSRLKVTDATGKELIARMQVDSADRLCILVEDSTAVYPVRIDPTFSDVDWTSMGGVAGAGGTVYAMAIDASGRLYIGGNFDTVGSVACSNIAMWDGSTWHALGLGVNNTVRALAVSGSTLYVGGEFTSAGGASAIRIANWNGTTWSAMDSVANGTVYAIGVSGSDVYVGGEFTLMDGSSVVDHIVKWNGTAWSDVAVSGPDGPVYAIAVSGTNVYVGGDFNDIGSTDCNNIALWNGTTWSPLGPVGNPGLNDTCRALTVLNSNLYAGGKFSAAGAVTARQIARWNGTTWSALGAGMNDATEVYALAVSNTNVYAGGQFTSADGATANHIARWNGSVWIALGAGVNGDVHSLLFSNNTVYAGGAFDTAGTVGAQCLARFDNPTSTWSSMASGTSGKVRAVAVLGTDVYVGGSFTVMGGVPARYIARWNGSTWAGLGTGLDGPVTSMAASATRLYVSGNFFTAGGLTATRIASWNGASWSAMGGLGGGGANALVTSGVNGLWAGGGFTTANGSTATSQVAFWNGSNWSTPLPTSIQGGTVYALALVGTDLYIGGDCEPDEFWRWSGSSMSPLGGNFSGTIYSMATSGTSVYVGGNFSYFGLNNLLRYTGTDWASVGTGPNETVRSLHVSGTTLYAGGDFTSIGGVPAERIARWNGTSWAALGSGLNNRCSGIAVLNGTAYVVGDFTRAGGQIAGYVARADVSGLPTTTRTNHTLLTTTSITLNGTVDPHGDVTTAQFQYGTTTGYGTNVPVTLSPNNGSGPQAVSAPVSGLTPGTLYHYRLAASNAAGTFNSSDGTFSTISTNANLAGLVPSAGTLSPAFSSATVSYTAGVSTTVPSIAITPTTSHPNATVKVNDVTVTSGSASQAISLAVGDNVITTVVTAEDGATTKTYTLIVTRLSDDASLASLVLSSGTLSPSFTSATTSYTSTAGVGSITVTPGAAEPNATIKVNNVTVASGSPSGSIALSPGSNTITVDVTAQNGVNTMSYSIAVTCLIPRIKIEQGSSVLVDGSNTPVNLGDTGIGFYSEVTFTIKNTGFADLDSFSFTKDGTDEALFTVTANPASTVPGPNGSTTFKVRFTPTTLGAQRSATLHIASNDPYTPSFDILVVGFAHTAIAGEISIDVPPGTTLLVEESAGEVLIPIARTGGLDGDVGFTITTTNGGAKINSDFTAPTPLQSMAHTVTSMPVAIPILDPPDADEGNETFTVTISNPTGNATLGEVKTVTVRIIDSSLDTKSPLAPVISTPGANALVNLNANGMVVIKGTATDNKGVTQVEVEVGDSGGITYATVTSPHAGTTAWEHEIDPQDGVVTISVRSVDAHNNVSPPSVRTFRVAAPLVVHVEPTFGSVTKGFAGSSYRQLGRSHTITATPKSTPAPGYIFTNWLVTGPYSYEEIGVTVESLEAPTLTFIHREGLELHANFAPNPFYPVAGLYRGLIASFATPGLNTEGSFTCTVQKTGAFSVTIFLDGQTLSSSGVLNQFGAARFGSSRRPTGTVTRPGKPSIELAFTLDFNTYQILGTADQSYRDVIVAQSSVYAELNVFNGTTIPVPPEYLKPGNANGAYTAVISLADDQRVTLDGAYFPLGFGFMSFSVSKAGSVSYSGVLSDGTPFSGSSTLSGYLNCPIFLPLYGGKGYFGGLLSFDVDDPQSDITSLIEIHWARPYLDRQHFRYGWPEVLNVDLTGSRYFVNSGESVLPIPDEYYGFVLPAPDGDSDGNAMIDFPNSFINFPVVMDVDITTADGVIELPAPDPGFSLTITRSTGRFSGIFTNPDNNQKVSYQGIIMGKGYTAGGYGYFLTPTPSVKTYDGKGGAVILQASP